MTDKTITFSAFSLSAHYPIQHKISLGWRFLAKFGLLPDTEYDQHNQHYRATPTADLNTKIANSGTYANYLAINHQNHPTTRYLSNAVKSVHNNSNLPPNLVVLQISRQTTHSIMSSQRFKAALIKTSDNSDMDSPKDRGDPNPEPTLEKTGSDTESSTIAKLDKSSESYTTMENSTPKDENHNDTGKISEADSIIITINSTSDSNTESEAEKLSKIITETREIATAIYGVLDATTESDGIGDVTPGYLAECDKILKLGNDVRDQVANNPVLAERVNRRQSLTLPPSPPKIKEDSGAEGDDEEDVDTGASDEGEEDDWENPGDIITPPTSPDGDGHGCCSNQDTCQEDHLCHFPGNDTVFTPCICISDTDNSSSSSFSVEFLGKTGVQGDVVEVKVEPASDTSETPRGHAETSNDSVIFMGEFDAQTSTETHPPRDAKSPKRDQGTPPVQTIESPPTSSKTWAQVGVKRKLSPELRATSGRQDVHKTGRPREPRCTQPETPEGTTRPVNKGAGRQGPEMTPRTLPSQPPTRSAGYPIFATMRRPEAAIVANLEDLLPLPLQQNPPRPQPEFLLGDESDLPYESEAGDYLDRNDFYLVRGNTIHPRFRRNDK